MADLNDLGIKSILDMGDDEAIEHLRQIRLARRTPAKPTKKTKKSTTKPKKQQAPKVEELTATQAANLLKILEENSK